MRGRQFRVGVLLSLLLAPLAAAGDGEPTKSAVASADAVAKFLNGWAVAEGTAVDAATGYPKRVKRTKDDAAMVLIPAGTFQMGALAGDSDAEADEKPRHAVTLSKAYYLDEHEATNSQFEAFVAATAHRTTAEVEGSGYVIDDEGTYRKAGGASWRTPLPGGVRPADWAIHPVVLVSWDDSKAFADWSKSSLPTEAQFERALRGGREDRKYPWGSELPLDILVGICAACLLVTLGISRHSPGQNVSHRIITYLERPALIWLGWISYSLYLIHTPVNVLIARFGFAIAPGGPWATILVMLLGPPCCLLIARGLADHVEYSLLGTERMRRSVIGSGVPGGAQSYH